jgi:uncharacterized protein
MASRDERPAFSFLIHELEAGPKTYDEPIEREFVAAALEGEDEFRPGESGGTMHVMLTKMGREILAVGTVKTTFVTACARCMQDAIIPVNGAFDAIAIPAAAPERPAKPAKAGAKAKKPPKPAKKASDEDDEDDLVDDGPDTIRYEGEHLVLDDVVRDALVLEIPMMPLCSESCPGIERPPLAEDASDRPIDPRFAALLSVKPGSKA